MLLLLLQAESQAMQTDSLQQAGDVQAALQEPDKLQLGTNVYTVVAVTGAVLYAQGLWGLW